MYSGILLFTLFFSSLLSMSTIESMSVGDNIEVLSCVLLFFLFKLFEIFWLIFLYAVHMRYFYMLVYVYSNYFTPVYYLVLLLIRCPYVMVVLHSFLFNFIFIFLPEISYHLLLVSRLYETNFFWSK